MLHHTYATHTNFAPMVKKEGVYLVLMIM